MRCPTESIGKLRYNILLQCTCKMLRMKHQTYCTDILHIVAVYISGRVTIHLSDNNSESTEFLPNSTGFKLVSGVDIRFQKIKLT